jgi:single-stranded DNA-binding protein
LSFSLATSRAIPDTTKPSGFGEVTVWTKVTLWGEKAERIAEKLEKGSYVLVTGRLEPTKTYTDKDGVLQHEPMSVTAQDIKHFPRNNSLKENVPTGKVGTYKENGSTVQATLPSKSDRVQRAREIFLVPEPEDTPF